MTLSQLLMAAVLTTAEFCDQPIEGGVGEPQFCRLTTNQEISTPYFSVVAESGFFVGVNREGRRMQVQSTLFKNQDMLTIEVLEGSSLPMWSDCPTVNEFSVDGVAWQDCHETSNGQYTRRLAAALSDRHVVIEYSYTSLATRMGPALERMTQSVKVHEKLTQP